MPRIAQAVLTVGLAAAIGVATCSAQENVSATAPLEHGPLVVWLVTPATAADKLRIAAQKRAATQVLPTTSEERTLSEFGQPASNVGQTAGSYGQTAGSVGTNASDHGQTASSYGTTPGNFGKAASEHGTNASDHGQTAGSFGQNASTYGDSLSSLNQARPVGTQPAKAPLRNALFEELGSDLRGTFKDLDVRFINVIAEELLNKLVAAQGSADYPDVVIGAALPAWWDNSGVGLAMLGTLAPLDSAVEIDSITGQPIPGAIGQRIGRVVVMTHAPHPEQARAFVVWLRDEGSCRTCGRTPDRNAQIPVSVAVGALGQVLQGDGLGASADQEAAQFNAAIARQLALMPPSLEALDGMHYRINVTEVSSNDRLAVVSLRAIGSSPQAFGVVHAVVVLRRNENRLWKVLQISPNVSPRSMGSASVALRKYAANVAPDKVAKLVGISQAAPPDGDNRPPQPDLWWDNGDSATLLVVEWQAKLNGWTDPRLLLVPTDSNRLQTRVAATFARNAGEYRWRVWSVGSGGVLVLSQWRTLNIVR